jgi:hypothetical protein
VSLLDGQDISLTNDRGYQVVLKKDQRGRKLIKMIVFSPGDALPLELRLKKAHVSRTAGFIHFIPAAEYIAILTTLVTIPEILEYLTFARRSSRTRDARQTGFPKRRWLNSISQTILPTTRRGGGARIYVQSGVGEQH